jgi:hypothetical protein
VRDFEGRPIPARHLGWLDDIALDQIAGQRVASARLTARFRHAWMRCSVPCSMKSKAGEPDLDFAIRQVSKLPGPDQREDVLATEVFVLGDRLAIV